jgi:hypothetical protein
VNRPGVRLTCGCGASEERWVAPPAQFVEPRLADLDHYTGCVLKPTEDKAGAYERGWNAAMECARAALTKVAS